VKIGILQCDDVADELQDEFGNYPAMFESMLAKIAPHFQFVTYRVVSGEFPDSAHECDGYITTGSRYGVNDRSPWIDQLEEFVATLVREEIKFVGICFGHQILAKALGGKVEQSDRGWAVGVSCNRVDVHKDWMSPQQEALNLVVSHHDQVVQLPEGIEVLASSDFCPYYMFQYGQHIMSVQGHPEFSKAYSDALMDKRANLIPAERIQKGKESLVKDVHAELMMRWIVNFFDAMAA
jgi:GMP synthase-like glutamine amidotransferase